MSNLLFIVAAVIACFFLTTAVDKFVDKFIHGDNVCKIAGRILVACLLVCTVFVMWR